MGFVETNALAALSLYWEVCRAGAIRLDAHADYASFTAALAPAVLRQFRAPREATEGLKQGQALFHQLASRRSDWDYYSSHLCRSELHHLLLEQRAVRTLSGMRVPHRLRTQRPLLVYRQVLSPHDYALLDRQIGDFFDELSSVYGVDIRLAEDTLTDQRAIAATAKAVWSRVLMEVMDGFIYGCAVVMMSDVLITRDAALREMANQIAQAPDAAWRTVRTSIRNELKSTLPGTGIAFPKGLRPQDPLPR